MLKHAQKAARKAKPSSRRVELRTVYRDTMKRYPKTMALLAE